MTQRCRHSRWTPNHKPKAEPVAVALTSWPFPVSTRYPQGDTQR